MSIWKQTVDCEQLNERGKGTLAEHLGIAFTAMDDHSCTATMPVDERTQQPLGILNGGASCALAETLGSAASNFCVPEGYYSVGLDINANHVKPATSGIVTAIATPIHLGRHTQVWGIEIKQKEKLCCIARLTMAVLIKTQGKSR